MTDDIRRRAACDRCHSQKIRCPRQPGQAVCSRCTKSGSRCIFSPFRQKKTPAEGYPETPLSISEASSNNNLVMLPGTPTSIKRRRIESPSPASHNQGEMTPCQLYGSFDVGDICLDWTQDPLSQDSIDSTISQLNFDNPTFEFQDDGSTPRSLSFLNYDGNPMSSFRKDNPGLSLKNAPQLLIDGDIIPSLFGSNPWTFQKQTTTLESTADCIKKLSTLSSDLFEHSQTIPPISIHDPDSVSEVKSINPGADDYSRYVVEETYRLTQSLIDIYPIFLNIFLDYTSPSISTPPYEWTHISPSTSTSNSTTPEDSTPNSTSINTSRSQPKRSKVLDHSSILLLSSCHLRVIDIYNELFKHMGLCIRQRGIALTPQAAQLKAPNLTIGSYTPPLSSTVPMQFLLLVQFASQLSFYASELVGELEVWDCVEDDERGMRELYEEMAMKLTRAATGNVKERAGIMVSELSRMRGALMGSGILA